MKKNILSTLAICAALLGCQKNEISETRPSGVELHATIVDDASTKTVMDENNNIRWSEGDQIIAFMKSSYGHTYQVKSSFIGETYADFSKVSSSDGDNLSAGMDWDHIVAYYPYAESIKCAKSGSNYSLSVVLPSEQTYAPESFGNASFPMVAVSEDNDITFKNVCGGMKLQLKGTQKVKSITLQGKNNEKLSGAATVIAYTDGETKPAITMATTASTSVTLNCGAGIQLTESTATDFIIALPPVLLSKGFIVTVTDTDSKTYTVETDKANTVLRSSILVMPPFKLGSSPSDEGSEDELVIPVVTVSLSCTSLKFYEGDSYQLIATVKPNDATVKTVTWSSDMPSVATVDQTGLVTGISAGTAYISATADGKVAKCTVTISPSLVATADYIDEYGVNHGRGIAIGRAIWAPVNCGYHKDNFKYGKLYQWGRMYGQGYNGNIYNVNAIQTGTYSDSTVPTMEEGGISTITGNHNSKSNVFFTSTSDWLYPQHNNLWNSGTEANPVKTEYDPCPDGWRVPTYLELIELQQKHSSWTTDENGQIGYWFSGETSYSEIVPQVFFPAAGYRRGKDGNASGRGLYGGYWSSKPVNTEVYRLFFRSSYIEMSSYYRDDMYRACGFSVRCVHE